MIKDLKLSAEAANMAKDTQAFIILHLNTNGQASIHIDGNAMEVCFMKEVLQDYLMKLIRGELQIKPS